MISEEYPPTSIFVDFRERKSGLVEVLKKADLFEVKESSLEIGDVVIGDLIIERKTVSELFASIKDKRLFRQLLNIKRVTPKKLLIIEGPTLLSDEWSMSSIEGLLVKISVGLQFPILRTSNVDQTVKFILRSAIQVSSEPNHSIQYRAKPNSQDLKFMQKFLLLGIRGLGVRAAQALLDHFGSPKKVFDASLDELRSVDGIGDKRAFSIFTILRSEVVE